MPNTSLGLPYPTNASSVSVPSDLAALANATDALVGAAGVVTTKGDLISRTASVNQRLGVGTNGSVLTADSTAATGLAWSSLSGAAWTPIAYTKLTSATATVTFSSISAGYTDLQARYMVRGSAAASTVTLRITHNGLSSGYVWVKSENTRTAGTVTRGTSAAFTASIAIPASSFEASQFAKGIIDIPFYTIGSKRGFFGMQGYADTTAGLGGTQSWGGENSNTTALSSLTFALSSGNFVSDCTFALYGLLKV